MSASESGFEYDFNTLWDYVEGRRSGWSLLIRYVADAIHLRAVKGTLFEVEEVEDLDFDAAAARLARKLARHGCIPA